jgi:phage gp29-like protein
MGLWDFLGRKVETPKRPELREIAAVSLRDRWSGYPSRGLTPGRLAWIMETADAGNMREQAELFEEMEEKDPHLAAVLQTRKLAVLGLEWAVTPADETPEREKEAEFCREVLEALSFKQACLHLLDAVGKGYAASEILWDYDGARAVVQALRPIHAKNITWVGSLEPLLVTEGNWQGEKPPPWKWIFHRHLARSGHDTRNGVLRVCAWMYLFKNYALKDWATFNEIFGMPLRLGKYEPSATPADREALRAAITSLGTDAAGIISKNTEIEFVEASARLSGITNPYQVMVDLCNREMSKAVLGQTLTTDTSGATGTYSAGKVHEEVRRDILEADAEALAETIREQLLRPLMGFNFGWDRPVPGFSFNLAEDEDLKALSETYKNLVEMGYPISMAHVSERFGIPLPEGQEEVIGGLGGAGSSQQGAVSRQQSEGKKPKDAKAQGLKAILPLRDGGGLELTEADRRAVKTQTELEGLVQDALRAGEELVARLLAPVRRLIETGESLEAIRDGLSAAYPEMRAEELGELLYQASLLAYMKARLAEEERPTATVGQAQPAKLQIQVSSGSRRQVRFKRDDTGKIVAADIEEF